MPCIWKEVENGKGEVYNVSCLGKASKGVNIYKLCKKRHISLISVFRECPYCGNKVQLLALKK